jgi:hypothetical protein
MTKSPSRKKAEKTTSGPSVIALPNLGEPGSLTPMNFRVSAQFHREFKVYAAQQGMTMVELLQESFHLLKEQRGH